MWIYLVRHAETDGNRLRFVQTPTTSLSKNGLRQAQQFALAYCRMPISHILCSDYKRTIETASMLHRRLKCDITLSELLRERNFGDLRGRTYDDIGHDFFAEDYHPKGGESHSQFAVRVGHAWQMILKIAQQKEGDLLVMTHGLVLRCLLTDVLTLPLGQVSQLDIKNTCVTKVRHSDHSDIPMLCDASHLGQTLSPLGDHGAV